jgi:hypothetical protein
VVLASVIVRQSRSGTEQSRFLGGGRKCPVGKPAEFLQHGLGWFGAGFLAFEGAKFSVTNNGRFGGE